MRRVGRSYIIIPLPTPAQFRGTPEHRGGTFPDPCTPTLTTMRLRTVLLASAFLAVASDAHAQGISLWLGAGRPVSDSGALKFKTSDLYVAGQFDLPGFPLAVRLEGMVAGSNLRSAPRSYFANAVFPVHLGAITPYGIAGYGAYSYGKIEEIRGYNYGGGVRLGLGRTGFFGELRRHEKMNKTQGTIGITF
jgi:hypothetical protein